MIEQKTQTQSAQLFKSMFEFQGNVFNNSFENLTEELALIRPHQAANHSNWLVGHIVHCRFMLSNMLGISAKNPFGDIYWEAIEKRKYSSLREMKPEFDVISQKLEKHLASMSEDELTSTPFPNKPALKDIISFFVFHEAYHLGQLGYIRKLIGLEALKTR